MSFQLRDKAKKIADKAVTATKETTSAIQEAAQSEETKEVGRKLRDQARKIADKAVTTTKETTTVVQEIAETEEGKKVRRTFKTLVKDALRSDIGKHAVGGLVAGAVIGVLLPTSPVILGAQLGLAVGVYRGITK